MSRYWLSALDEIDAALRGEDRLLIATDLDGTLCPIASSPEEARLPPAMVEVARRIGICDHLTFAVISGRPLDDLTSRIPTANAFAGNHGLEVRAPNLEFIHPGAVAAGQELRNLCMTLAEELSPWPGAWVEDKWITATVHYRKVDASEHRRLRFAVRRLLSCAARHFSLRTGKAALEICPRVEWDKGSAVSLLRTHLGPFHRCICLGDDRTDESMFRANADGINVRVGCDCSTQAAYHLFDSIEAAMFLEHVIDCSANRTTKATVVSSRPA